MSIETTRSRNLNWNSPSDFLVPKLEVTGLGGKTKFSTNVWMEKRRTKRIETKVDYVAKWNIDFARKKRVFLCSARNFSNRLLYSHVVVVVVAPPREPKVARTYSNTHIWYTYTITLIRWTLRPRDVRRLRTCRRDRL